MLSAFRNLAESCWIWLDLAESFLGYVAFSLIVGYHMFLVLLDYVGCCWMLYGLDGSRWIITITTYFFIGSARPISRVNLFPGGGFVGYRCETLAYRTIRASLVGYFSIVLDVIAHGWALLILGPWILVRFCWIFMDHNGYVLWVPYALPRSATSLQGGSLVVCRVPWLAGR